MKTVECWSTGAKNEALPGVRAVSRLCMLVRSQRRISVFRRRVPRTGLPDVGGNYPNGESAPGRVDRTDEGEHLAPRNHPVLVRAEDDGGWDNGTH